MRSEDLEKYWKNPANWSGLYYSCPDDPRLVVPKRRGVGWTVNFGHPRGKLAMVFLVLIGLVPPVYVIWKEGPVINPVHILYAVGVSCLISMAFCMIFSRGRAK